MKKNKLLLLVTVVLIVAAITYFSNSFSRKNTEQGDIYVENYVNENEFEITDVANTITENIFSSGCVRNVEDAAEIAKIILRSVYGEDFDNALPLTVKFDAKKQEWLINTQLPDGVQGGQLYIIIRRSNAEVVAIWGTR
jgi:hypothetical protein